MSDCHFSTPAIGSRATHHLLTRVRHVAVPCVTCDLVRMGAKAAGQERQAHMPAEGDVHGVEIEQLLSGGSQVLCDSIATGDRAGGAELCGIIGSVEIDCSKTPCLLS